MINPIQMMQMLTQLKSNPSALLSQFGIPQNMMNDPKAVIQHLMNNGRITQDQYNAAVQQAQSMGYKM